MEWHGEALQALLIGLALKGLEIVHSEMEGFARSESRVSSRLVRLGVRRVRLSAASVGTLFGDGFFRKARKRLSAEDCRRHKEQQCGDIGASHSLPSRHALILASRFSRISQ